MTAAVHVRRSFLYVPPAHAASLDASRDSGADVVCYDLEDSTPPPAKVASRQTIADHLAAGRPKAREVLVRVNALDTEWGHEDLRFAASLGVDGVLLPKVEGDGVARQAKAVLAAASDTPPALWCLIETPLGILRAEQVAAVGVEAFVVGGADLAEGLGAAHVRSRLPLWHALSQVVLVARAYGLSAIDAMHMDFGDIVGFEAECQQAVEMGFDGKSVFTAKAAAIANRAFAPSPDAIARAEASIARASGYGSHGGHAGHARRLLDYARACGEPV